MRIYVGQNGVEKSGNYLLYRILKSLIESDNEWYSYTQETGCWEPLYNWDQTDKSFPEMRSMDEFLISADGTLYHLNSQFKASFAIWEREQYDSMTSILWTHQSPRATHFEMLSMNRTWFYILRDGRSVVNSWMHYAVTHRMLKRHPQYSVSDVNELYSQIEYFKKNVLRWCSHVNAYLDFQDQYSLVIFEDLVANKAETIKYISNAMGLGIGAHIAEAVQQSDINKTIQDAPGHVRLGSNDDWNNYFTNQHIEIYQKLAGKTLARLGQKLYLEW